MGVLQAHRITLANANVHRRQKQPPAEPPSVHDLYRIGYSALDGRVT
jgi:hypothetical protein